MTYSDVSPPPRQSPLLVPGRTEDAAVDRLGNYDIERHIGMGGMGMVYQARDLRTGSAVALKVLKHAHPRAIAAFKREFRALAEIHHENLASLYELATDGEQWYLAMELIDGGTPFVDAVRASPTPVATLREALGQLARGLVHLHQHDSVHRDVKPSNVLVQPSGRVVLLDFGLVSHLPDHRTEPGKFVVGTVNYIAPELVVVGGRLSPACDWYATGVMLYECLTGRVPYHGTRYDILRAKIDHDPVHPRELSPDAPAELADLCMRLLERDPETRARGPEVLAVLGGHELPQRAVTRRELVGRGRHLAALDGAASTVRTGVPVVACVHGESGMGKSSLVQAFTERAARRHDSLVLHGRCYERESVPYKGLDAVVEGLAHHLRSLPPQATRRLLRGRGLEHAARVFPSLAELPGMGDAGDLDGVDLSQDARHRALTALRALLQRVAGKRLVVIALDDVQWIDLDGAELLAALAEGPVAPPVLIVLSFRTSDAESATLASLLARVRRDRSDAGLRWIEVGALAAADAARLARELGADLGSRDWSRVVAETGGSPYLVSELVRFLRLAPESTAAPPLERVIDARVDLLPPGARALLEVVCLAGHPIDAASAVATVGAADGSAALAALRAAHLIRGRALRGGDAVEPYHDRIRETVAASVPPARAQALHLALAGAIEAIGPASAEELAAHYHAGGQSERALAFTVQAAETAARALAFDKAAVLYRRALEHGGDGVDRRALSRGLADALAAMGRGAAAAAAYREAADCSDGVAALELRSRAADQLLRSGRVAEGMDAFRTVLGELGIQTAASPRRALWAGVMRRARIRLRGLGFRSRGEDELDPAARIRVDTLYSVASGFALVDPMRAMEVQAQHAWHALRLGEPYRVARALAGHAAPLAARGSDCLPTTARILARADELAEASGHPHARGLVELVRGFAAYGVGDWRGARASLSSAEACLDHECVGAAWELATCRFFYLATLWRTGEYAVLRQRIGGWLADAERRRDLHAMVNLGMAAGYQQLAADDPEGAHAEIDRASAYWDHNTVLIRRYRGYYMHALAYLYEGAMAPARAAIDQAWSCMREAQIDRIQEVRIVMTDTRGQVACGQAALAVGAERRRLVREARAMARTLERQRLPWALGLARRLRAQIGFILGDRDRAIAHLGDAMEILEAASMPGHAAAARRTLGVLVGGDAGAGLVAAGEAQLAARGAVDPRRMAVSMTWDPAAPG